MKIGYVRISSKDQNMARQHEKFKGYQKIFTDKDSGANFQREGLTKLLDFIREGDIVVVSELERLGRNNKELTNTIEKINKAGATLEVLNLPTLTGIEDDNLRRLINNIIIEIYKYQAEAERKNILQRQAEGIAIAKKLGKYKGRQPKYKKSDSRLQHAFDLYLNGNTDKDIERLTGINARTFRRYRQKYNIYRDS
ncbi:TPA: recombinase family protein [Streptococcus suis]